jgi:LuxR family transcriptional regulator, maltose regulon positive regulatory protein
MPTDLPRPAILETKLTPPANGRNILERMRLNQQLESAHSFPVTLVTAPAGYGKTTLLAAFAASHPGETAWLSLEPHDDDPARFWPYLTAALRKAFPSLRLNVPIFLPGMGSDALTGGLDTVCNELAGLNAFIGVIMDDTQSVTRAEIWQGLAYLAEHLPGNAHLVFSGRVTPALPLTRLKVKNRLSSITARELAFNVDETRAFFSSLPTADADRIAGAAGGWPAGIRLMEFARRELPLGLDSIKEGRRLAVDYLTEEILRPLNPQWVTFTRRAAVFETFTPAAAAAVTGNEDASVILEAIREAGLFLEPTGDEYRFHPFFRDALRETWSREEAEELHRSAAAWHEAHGDVDLAVNQALIGGDWVTAIRLIRSAAETKLRGGELHSLSGWLLALPDDELPSNPDLLVLLAWTDYMLARIPELQSRLPQLEELSAAGHIQNTGMWAGLQCQLALLREDNRSAQRLAEDALRDLPGETTFLRGILLHSLASAHQALAHTRDAVTAFRESIEANIRSGNRLVALFSLISLSLELDEQGHLRQASDLCEETATEIIPPGEQVNPLTGLVNLMSARLDWERDDLGAMARHLEESSGKLESLGIIGFQISGEMMRAYLLMAHEEYGEALALVNRNRQKTRTDAFTGYNQIFNMLRADICLRMGRTADAAGWLDKAALPASPFDDPAREMEFMLAARFLLESGAEAECSARLGELENYARQVSHQRLLIALLLNRASLEWKRGNPGPVRILLEEALSLARPEGYVRVLLDNAGPLLGLIAQLPGAPQSLRERFPTAPAGEVAGLVEILTSREMDVLHLLADNRTNQEIAAQLFLSGETVKVHLKHIFQKLGVNDRRQAVRQARDLNLI